MPTSTVMGHVPLFDNWIILKLLTLRYFLRNLSFKVAHLLNLTNSGKQFIFLNVRQPFIKSLRAATNQR